MRMSGLSIVYFDLETTGGGRYPQIVSIGACYDTLQIRIYICPTCDIDYYATMKHGLSLRRGELYLEDELLEARVYTPRGGLDRFGHFIRDVQRIVGEKQLHLMSHNAFGSDLTILKHNMEKFQCGMIPRDLRVLDSQDVARRMESKYGPVLGGRLGLDNLLSHNLGERQSEPHDALDDALDTRRLFNWMKKRLRIGKCVRYMDLFE